MGKAKRKPRPSAPLWFLFDMDGCWFCKTPMNCNRCKSTKIFRGIRRQLRQDADWKEQMSNDAENNFIIPDNQGLRYNNRV